ncbi:uncharacterized protein TNCV_3684711 [Trichonephila clavipes]|uniref:Transposase n=1 Tax=Trichonephila clavipes TaxID=2585209 RepID=A0A8X6RMQ5_TRICX|nr:uncharacterized protein TNCV_3684711 [Trichonephila clavipes]
MAVVPDFHKRILFSDEAHFWLNGYVNKQNCRIWSEANSQVYVETPLDPEKLTVWSALWAGGIIGVQKTLELIFFATAVEKNVQKTVAAAMTIVTTCCFTFRSHPPLSRKPRLSIYTGDVLVTSSTVMLRTLKNGVPSLGNHSFTVNGDRYRAMITNFFIPELNNHDVQELWFQQDDAICHTTRATIDLLKDTFGDRLISRFGPGNWPPRSCDITPLDYFLWGYVKSLVYADKPQTLDHLEDNIRRVIIDIRPQMVEKIIENWTSSLDYIRASRGSPMPEIIFKM